MKRSRIFTAALCLILCGIMCFNMSGCGKTSVPEPVQPSGGGQTDDTGTGPAEPENIKGSDVKAAVDFAVKLMQKANNDGESTLISPLSVLSALAMAANGADGKTKEQMEKVFGMTADELNVFLYSYISSLPQGEKYKLEVANSIWIRDTEALSVKDSFLETNSRYYGPQVYKEPFDDSTAKAINEWVKQNTDGLIDSIIDRISPETIMYLINALVFDAEWNDIYEDTAIQEGEFTKEDGTKTKCDFMYGSEYRYLSGDGVTGFIKDYSEGKYAFAALLPDEGTTVSEYLASLDGDKLVSILDGASEEEVRTCIPKFRSETETELNGCLIDMGMPDAFSPETADFTRLGEMSGGENIYIGEVLHKTYIDVDERGTKAGAVTAISMKCGSTLPIDEPKIVYLDRPFVYMIIDCENRVPVFMGTMTDPLQ